MEREALLFLIAVALFGTVTWSCAALARGAHRAQEISPERASWRLLWPLAGGTMMVAFLVGWALQEPDPADEWIGQGMAVLAGFTGIIVLRALMRACMSLRRALEAEPIIATVGILRTSIVVSEPFRRAASAPVLAAALAHERAHARARDPLRLWLAQLACDLQWPIPGARGRLEDWQLALELRRDEEALALGVSPTDLAESIVLAARLSTPQAAGCMSAITGGGGGLAFRVQRLLDAGPRSLAARPRPGLVRRWTLLALGLACCFLWLGYAFGEATLAIMPGVLR